MTATKIASDLAAITATVSQIAQLTRSTGACPYPNTPPHDRSDVRPGETVIVGSFQWLPLKLPTIMNQGLPDLCDRPALSVRANAPAHRLTIEATYDLNDDKSHTAPASPRPC